MPTQEEITLWNEWLHTDGGRGYEAGWGDHASRDHAERGKAWVAGRIAERRIQEAEIARLRFIVDVITGPPLTIEEAEQALDNLPELDQAEKDAMARIDIKKIIAYAADPMNASPEWVIKRLIVASKDPNGLDRRAFDEAEAWLERRWS